MLKCEKVELILARYVVGALPPWSRIALARHLDQCPPCRRLLDLHHGIAMLVEVLPPQEPPVGLWNAVAHEIGHETPGHQPVPTAGFDWRPKVAVAAAGLALGVAVGQWWSAQPLMTPSGGGSSIATMAPATPRIATFVQQHGRLSFNDPLTDQVSLAAYVTTAFRDNERMEGNVGTP